MKTGGRTWSRLDHQYEDIDRWTEKNEDEEAIEEKRNDMLLEQRYGMENEWKIHFDDFLFFDNKRYIKKDGAPTFFVYKSKQIKCLAEMIYFSKVKNL